MREHTQGNRFVGITASVEGIVDPGEIKSEMHSARYWGGAAGGGRVAAHISFLRSSAMAGTVYMTSHSLVELGLQQN